MSAQPDLENKDSWSQWIVQLFHKQKSSKVSLNSTAESCWWYIYRNRHFLIVQLRMFWSHQSSLEELEKIYLNGVFVWKMEMEPSIHTEIMTSMFSVKVMALSVMPFLEAKQILQGWWWGGCVSHPERLREMTRLITSCHCVPGCQNISVSVLCVKHRDNSKS